MRWVLRHAVFAFCLSLGSMTWFILAQNGAAPAPPAQAVVAETSTTQTIAPTDSEQPEEALPGQSIKFGPVGHMSGYINTQTVILRESAEANAPVVARLQPGDYEAIEILGATRDFLHVRFVTGGGSADDGSGDGSTEKKKNYEGWTTWGAVVPDTMAIVLDAETGAVVSRIPLGEGHTSVIFSPDGSRAIFSSEYSSQTAYEVRTSDYTLMRSLASADNETFSALFYAPTSGDVYARVYASGEKLVRISAGDAPNMPTIIGPNIIVSRDGQTGLIVRREEGDDSQVLTVEVMDTTTLEVRSTFKLTGSNLSADGSGFILNRDGSELYLRPSDSTGAISVIETRTGQFLRELPDSATQSWSYFWQDSIVGDSVLLRAWDEDGDEMHQSPARYWVSNGKRTLAEPGVDHAIEAGGKRFAVNEEGTVFLRLNDNNRIQQRFKINRPERREGAEMGNSLTVFGLRASPDGKHIIMFVGMEHGC